VKYADLPEAIHHTLTLEGEMTAADLAEQLGVSVGWIQSLLPRMETRGLIERASEPEGWFAS
jgi:DNA-binding MarR family transcriptional regulator